MKRKLLTISLGILIFACFLAISSFATVNYSETATLADGTVLPIYDENQNPLIWYISGVDENGKNIYKSVPNNRNEQNTNNDDFVTYTINTSWMTQLQDVNFHIYNGSGYDVINDKTYNVVVLNLRGLTSFQYINKGLGVSSIQYIYFNEILADLCDYFQKSQNLRLVDLSVSTNLSGGFGGVCNFQECINLHTIRLAPGTSYTLKCNSNRNYRFKNTAITDIIIPENIINIGVDNFNGCKNLESVYILGNTTSLGQRNFSNCPKLTNIYILGNNPTIDLTSFKENFYECVDNGKVLDFKSTGKYFFFVTTNTEYLNGVKDAIGATAIISYNDYKASPDKYTEGRYVISGTNICDTLYDGVHSLDENNSNPCAGLCTVCGEMAQAQNQVHDFTTKITYTNYLASGVRSQICANEGCKYSENPYISDTDAVISEFKGISTKINGDGLTFGYSVNYDALDEYVKVNGGSVELGFVVAVKSFLDGKMPLDENGIESTSKVIKATLLTWSQDTDNQSVLKYASADFKIVGNWDVSIDLDGDQLPEADIKDVKFYMAGYIIDGDTVKYINYQKTSDTPDNVAYNDCL